MMTTPKPPPLDSESCTSLRREGHAVVNLLEPPSPLVCSFKNERRLLSNPKKAAAAELNQAAPVDVDVRTQQLPTLEDICHKGSVVTVRHQPPPRPNRSNRMFVFDKVKTKEFFDEKENKPKSLSMSLMSAESLIEKQDDSESTMMDETETETETETESGEIGEGPWDTSIVAGAGALPPVAFVPEVVATTNFWELCYGVPAPRVVDTRSLSAQRPPPSKSWYVALFSRQTKHACGWWYCS